MGRCDVGLRGVHGWRFRGMGRIRRGQGRVLGGHIREKGVEGACAGNVRHLVKEGVAVFAVSLA